MDNKVVLITGAAKRIGAVIAETVHHQGMDVVLHYHQSSEQAVELAEKLNSARPNSSFIIQADLNDSTCHQVLIEKTLAFKSRLDVLINNASVFYPTPLANITDAQWSELNNVNLKSPYFLSIKAAQAIKMQRGSIINITDIHGLKPLREFSIYSISKAGLITMTQSLARELAPGVRVNAVAPGAITWPDDMSEKKKENILNTILLKRQGHETDIANAVLFLINDADYITGQTLSVDGGRNIKL